MFPIVRLGGVGDDLFSYWLFSLVTLLTVKAIALIAFIRWRCGLGAPGFSRRNCFESAGVWLGGWSFPGEVRPG